MFFSKIWNIVESKEYANLIEESGTGFISGPTNPMYGKKLGSNALAIRSGKFNHQAKAVRVGEKLYDTVTEAAKQLNCNATSVRYRINSPNFSHYNYS